MLYQPPGFVTSGMTGHMGLHGSLYIAQQCAMHDPDDTTLGLYQLAVHSYPSFWLLRHSRMHHHTAKKTLIVLLQFFACVYYCNTLGHLQNLQSQLATQRSVVSAHGSKPVGRTVVTHIDESYTSAQHGCLQHVRNC